jgi:hypothetical protein
MAAKKTASAPAKAAPVPGQAAENIPGLDPELAKAREDALAAEPKVKVAPPEEPGIDPELVKAREKALKDEKNPKTIGSL